MFKLRKCTILRRNCILPVAYIEFDDSSKSQKSWPCLALCVASPL